MFRVNPPAIESQLISLFCALVAALVLPALVAYARFVERKINGDEPRRVDPQGSDSWRFFAPVTTAATFLLREGATPLTAARFLFYVSPLTGVMIALLAYSVLPIGPAFQIADPNVGLLFVLGIASLSVYRVTFAGSVLNIRSAVRLVSYETAAALSLVSVLLLSGSLSMKEIVQAQLDRGQWFVFYVPIGFAIYFVASLAATSHAPLDPPELDSSIASGELTEHHGFRGAIDSLIEYVNIVIVAGIATTAFLGGWLRPLAGYRDRFPGTTIELLDVLPAAVMATGAIYFSRRASRQEMENRKNVMRSCGGLCLIVAAVLTGTLFAPETVMQAIHGAFWFLAKLCAYIYCFFWVRFELPEFLADRSARLCWRVLVPLAFANLITAAVAILTSQNTGLPMRLTTILATTVTLAATVWLVKESSFGTAPQMAGDE
jgi:NADH-quinone oxidoreductase subunit H